MLKIFACFILCFLLTDPLHADDEISIQRASLAQFPHKQHQTTLGGCTDCHGSKGPGPIAEFGEKWAHDTCAGCHRENKTGPEECSGCHVQN